MPSWTPLPLAADNLATLCPTHCRGLNQVNADIRFKGSGADNIEFWLALTKRIDLKTLVAGMPAIGSKLADM